jgi:hypothetical protein
LVSSSILGFAQAISMQTTSRTWTFATSPGVSFSAHMAIPSMLLTRHINEHSMTTATGQGTSQMMPWDSVSSVRCIAKLQIAQGAVVMMRYVKTALTSFFPQ